MLGVTLGLLCAVGLSNLLHKIAKPSDQSNAQYNRLQRNFTSLITLLLTTIIDVTFFVLNQLLSYRIIIGLSFVPLCIAFYSEPMTVIRFLDRSYNILYTGAFMPLKLVLNLVRYLFDLLIGIWNFIVESYNSVWDVLVIKLLKEDPAKLKDALFDISKGIAQIIVQLIMHIVNVLTAFLRSAPPDEIVSLTVFTDAYHDARELIEKGLSILADILSDICQGYASIDFTSIFITVMKLGYSKSPVYDLAGHAVEALMVIPKCIYLFALHTIPIWAETADGEVRTTIIRYDTVLSPFAEIKVSIAQFWDHVFRIISNMASCYFTKFTSIEEQTACVVAEDHGLFLLPEQGYMTWLAYTMRILQRVIFYVINVIMNWHIIGLDITLEHQKLKFDVMMPHQLYESASIAIKSIRDFVSTVKVFAPFASAVEDGARGILLSIMLAFYAITTILMGQNIPMCPGVPGVDTLSSPLCLCNVNNFDFNTHTLPFVQPEIVDPAASELTYKCPLLETAGTYNAAEFQHELQAMPPCERDNMQESFPPYRVKNAKCVCHPNRDASTANGYCQCGTPLCDCTLPFKVGEYVYCNFRPEDIKLPQHTTLKSNDLVNVCTDIYGTESAARIDDATCLCATTLEPPHEASPVGSGMYYCPTLCDSRLEEFVYMKNKTVQTSSSDIISYDMVYGCQKGTSPDRCVYQDQTNMLPRQFYRQMYAQELFDSYSAQQVYMNYEEKCVCRINTYNLMSQLQLYPYAGDEVPTDKIFAITYDDVQSYHYETLAKNPIPAAEVILPVGVLRDDREHFVIPVDSWSHCNCPAFSRFAYGPLAGMAHPGGTPYFETDTIMQYKTYTQDGHITDRISLNVSMPICSVQTSCPIDTTFVNPFTSDASTRLLYLTEQNNIIINKNQYFTVGSGIMPQALCHCSNTWPPFLVSDIFNTDVPFHFYSLEDRLLCATSLPNVVDGVQYSRHSVSVQDIDTTTAFVKHHHPVGCALTSNVFIGPSGETYVECADESSDNKIKVLRIKDVLQPTSINMDITVINNVPTLTSETVYEQTYFADVEVKLASVEGFDNNQPETAFSEYGLGVFADGIVVLSGTTAHEHEHGNLFGKDLRHRMKQDHVFKKSKQRLSPDYVHVKFPSKCGKPLVNNPHAVIFVACEDALYEVAGLFIDRSYSGLDTPAMERKFPGKYGKNILKTAVISDHARAIYALDTSEKLQVIPFDDISDDDGPDIPLALAPMPPHPPPLQPPPPPPANSVRVALNCIPRLRRSVNDLVPQDLSYSNDIRNQTSVVVMCGLYNKNVLNQVFGDLLTYYAYVESGETISTVKPDTHYISIMNTFLNYRDLWESDGYAHFTSTVSFTTNPSHMYTETTSPETNKYTVVVDYDAGELENIVPFAFLPGGTDYSEGDEQRFFSLLSTQIALRESVFMPGGCGFVNCAPFSDGYHIEDGLGVVSNISNYTLANLLGVNDEKFVKGTSHTYMIQMAYFNPHPDLDEYSKVFYVSYTPTVTHRYFNDGNDRTELLNFRPWGPLDDDDYGPIIGSRRRTLLASGEQASTIHKRVISETKSSDIISIHNTETQRTALYRAAINSSALAHDIELVHTLSTITHDVDAFIADDVLHAVSYYNSSLLITNVIAERMVCEVYFDVDPIIIQIDGETMVHTYTAVGTWVSIHATTCQTQKRDLALPDGEKLRNVFMVTDHRNQTDGVMYIITDKSSFAYHSKNADASPPPSTSRRRRLLQESDNTQQPASVPLVPALFTKDNFVTRLHTVLGQSRQFVFLPLIAMGDHLRDTFQDDYPSLALTSRHMVRTVAYLLNAVATLFSETIRSISNSEFVDSSKITDQFTFLFVEVKALGNTLDMIYDLASYLFPKSMGGGVAGVCGRTEYANMMIPNGLKSYHFTWETCSDPAVQAVRCPFGQEELFLCNMTYAPEHTFNMDILCTITETISSAIRSILEIVELVVNIVITDLIGVINCIEDIALDPHNFIHNSECSASSALSQLTSLIHMVQCTLFNTISRAAGLLPNALVEINFVFYGIAGRERQIKPPRFLPVDCPGIGDIETCSEIGYNGIRNRTQIRETSIQDKVFYVMNHPVCMYNMTEEACGYACEVFEAEDTCTASFPEGFDGYCMWASDQCKTNLTAISESFTKGLPETHQLFPIDAGMHTLATGIIGGIPIYVMQALEQVVDIVITPLEDMTMDKQTPLTELFEVYMVDATDLMEIRIWFAIIGNAVLYVRDFLMSILMLIRGFVLAIGHKSTTMVSNFDKFERAIMEIMSLVESLYVSLTDTLVVIVKDTIEFLVRLIAAFGAGISKNGFASLAASLYEILKEYVDLVIGLIHNMFVNSEFGQGIQVVFSDVCGSVDDISRIVYQGIRISYCEILATHIIFGKSILNLAGKHKPEWCSSDSSYKSFKDRCDIIPPDGDTVVFSYEASVCSGGTSKCKQCVARTAADCNVIGYSENGDTSPDSWAAACPCESCAHDFYCDTATGLCVCGTERGILFRGNFTNTDFHFCAQTGGTYPTHIGSAKQCLMQNPLLTDGFCKVIDASAHTFATTTCDARLDEVKTALNKPGGIPDAHTFDYELLCRSVCGNMETQNQNELVFSDTGEAVCVLSTYQHLNGTCLITDISNGRRARVGDQAMGWEPVMVSDECEMHSDCGATSVCTASSGLMIDTVACDACTERTNDMVTRVYGCDAVDHRCTCGVGPYTRPSIHSQDMHTRSIYDLSDFDLFLDPREWQGDSFCDRLVRAYMQDVLRNSTMVDMSPVAALEVRRCMELRAMAFAARGYVGLYTLPLNIAYDASAQLLFAFDALRALGYSFMISRNESFDETTRRVYFASVGVESQLGEYVYQTTSSVVTLVRSTFSLNGTLHGLARVAEDMSGDDLRVNADRITRDVATIGEVLSAAGQSSSRSIGEVVGIASELMAIYAEERQNIEPTNSAPLRTKALPLPINEPQRRRLMETTGEIAEDIVTTRTCPIVRDVINRVASAANRSINYYNNQFQSYSACRFTNAFNVLDSDYDPRMSIQNCSNTPMEAFSFVSAVFDVVKTVDPLAIGEHASEASANTSGVYYHIHHSIKFASGFSFKKTALYWLDYIRDEIRLDHFNDYLICQMDPIYGGRHVNHVADALVKTAVLFVVIVLLNPLPPSLTIITFPFQLLLIYMSFLWIAYDFHPGCFTTFTTFFVAAPVTLADDLYDVLDAFVLPPTLQWTGTDRSSTGQLSANGDLDVCLDLFRDGIDNFMYLLRRGSGEIDWTYAHFFEFEPFTHAIQTFKDLTLLPNDAYENCFMLTSINLVPFLAMFVISVRVIFRLISALIALTIALTTLVLTTIS